jgi:hypothetical protein
MELLFLGHQSWWVRSGDVTVLIDPVLTDHFGHRTSLPVHPPRDLDVDGLLPIDLVVLSHEHNDHLDLPSLARLPRAVPILVAPLLPGVFVRAIERLGFSVHRADPEVALSAGLLSIQLLPGASRAPVSEGRVAQILLTERLGEEPSTVLIGVDTAISSHTTRAMHRGELPTPDLVIVANNTQLPPPGVVGSSRDLLAPDPGEGFVGIHLLQDLCIRYVAELPRPPTIALCGGGFLDTHELGVPYAFDNHPHLAGLARALAPGRPVLGPEPGDRLHIKAGHIQLIQQAHPAVRLREDELAARRARPAPQGLLPLRSVLPTLSELEWSAALARLDRALDDWVPALLAHPQGDAIVGCNRFRERSMGPRRCLVCLVGGPAGEVAWRALDLLEGRFVHIETIDQSTILDDWPFGFEAFAQDLDAVLTGNLVVWDVLGVALRHWSASGPGMASVLCSTLSESVRPAATARALASVLTQLGVPTGPEELMVRAR